MTRVRPARRVLPMILHETHKARLMLQVCNGTLNGR
jgi:hypothetical protein